MQANDAGNGIIRDSGHDMSVLKPVCDALERLGQFLGEGCAKSIRMKTETFKSDIFEGRGILSAKAAQVEGLQGLVLNGRMDRQSLAHNISMVLWCNRKRKRPCCLCRPRECLNWRFSVVSVISLSSIIYLMRSFYVC